MEYADLDALVDLAVQTLPTNEVMLQRLKKRRLHLRDLISILEQSLQKPEQA